jgi:hypothetical protein
VWALPLEGCWEVQPTIHAGVFYTVNRDPTTGGGTITVEYEGAPVGAHAIDVKNDGTIIVLDAIRGPHEVQDEVLARLSMSLREGEKLDLLSGMMIRDILTLKEPPRELRFSRDTVGKPESSASAERLYVHGLIQGLEAPIPLARVSESDRVCLPFKVEAEYTFDVPAGTTGVLAGPDGPISSARVAFEPPLRTSGSVRFLMVRGRQVDLETGEMHGGMVATKQFGELEFLIRHSGPDGYEIRATLPQLRQLRAWIDATSK